MKARGFSTIEALLSASIIFILASAIFGAFIYGNTAGVYAGNQNRATYLAEEGLEAVKAIRSQGFSNLVDGSYGLSATGSTWQFSGTSDTTDEYFNRQIVISSAGTNRKQVVATVTWQNNPQRSGSVSLTTYITNWKPF